MSAANLPLRRTGTHALSCGEQAPLASRKLSLGGRSAPPVLSLWCVAVRVIFPAASAFLERNAYSALLARSPPDASLTQSDACFRVPTGSVNYLGCAPYERKDTAGGDAVLENRRTVECCSVQLKHAKNNGVGPFAAPRRTPARWLGKCSGPLFSARGRQSISSSLAMFNPHRSPPAADQLAGVYHTFRAGAFYSWYYFRTLRQSVTGRALLSTSRKSKAAWIFPGDIVIHLRYSPSLAAEPILKYHDTRHSGSRLPRGSPALPLPVLPADIVHGHSATTLASTGATFSARTRVVIARGCWAADHLAVRQFAKDVVCGVMSFLLFGDYLSQKAVVFGQHQKTSLATRAGTRYQGSWVVSNARGWYGTVPKRHSALLIPIEIPLVSRQEHNQRGELSAQGPSIARGGNAGRGIHTVGNLVVVDVDNEMTVGSRSRSTLHQNVFMNARVLLRDDVGWYTAQERGSTVPQNARAPHSGRRNESDLNNGERKQAIECGEGDHIPRRVPRGKFLTHERPIPIPGPFVAPNPTHVRNWFGGFSTQGEIQPRNLFVR
ncbi:hypothetical protein C8R47DRAFT_1201065 [Mycena vitilis]|nr:hypothetical protein C8R47DRAFT_1201065 [Mycena vitilis]